MSAMDDYVSNLVAAAPPLTPEQRDRLASLLTPIQAYVTTATEATELEAIRAAVKK